MKLVVGLGNPGKRYEKTRHNIGFLVLDELAKSQQAQWSVNKKFNAATTDIMHGEEKIILAKPLTYMNESGQAVGLMAHYYSLSPTDIIVVHDDKDIDLGKIMVQKNRGHAGHNGIKSIFSHLGTKDIERVRVGVASKNNRRMQDTASFVLGKFSLLERRAMQAAITEAMTKVQTLL